MDAKNIKKYEDIVYQAVLAKELEVDDQGRVWRIAKRGWDRWNNCVRVNKCKRVRAENEGGDYLQVRVMFNGKRYHACAHRLVFRVLKGEIPVGMTVNHDNGNKHDNSPDNLMLATHSEQSLHALHVLGHGRTNQWGVMNSMAKLTAEDVTEIRRRRLEGEKLATIAASFGISQQQVSKIALGQRRQHCG